MPVEGRTTFVGAGIADLGAGRRVRRMSRQPYQDDSAQRFRLEDPGPWGVTAHHLKVNDRCPENMCMQTMFWRYEGCFDNLDVPNAKVIDTAHGPSTPYCGGVSSKIDDHEFGDVGPIPGVNGGLVSGQAADDRIVDQQTARGRVSA